jgi:hypothetical protein
MKRFFKRLWFRLTHKHVWEIIHEGTWIGKIENNWTGSIRDATLPAVIERCWCGRERGRVIGANGDYPLNPGWMRIAAGITDKDRLKQPESQ